MRLDGIKIYTLIKQQEKNQRIIADEIGMSRCNLNGIINGRSCREETAEKIAAALGVSVADITEKRK